MSAITPDPASPSLLPAFSAHLAALVGATAPTVVAVHSHGARSSGFFWRPGLIVTADEALAEEGDIAVALPGGERSAAVVVGRDPATDIALLRVDRPGVPVPPLKPSAVAAGTLVVAVGSRDGTPTAALGIASHVAGEWRSLRGGTLSARIELDLALRRADEGALVVDADSRTIGMAVFGPRRRVLVIPADTIERIAATLERHGRIPRGYLGLSLQPVRLGEADTGVADTRVAGTGVMVMNVDRTGPGAAADIRQGDVIVAWSGQPVDSLRTVLRALGPDSVGTTVAVSLRRAGAPLNVQLTIGERPPA